MEYLYKHSNGILFRRVAACDLADLTALKNESWFGTHRVALVSEASQARWLAALDAEDVHTPRNLVLVASAFRKKDAPPPLPEDHYPSGVGIFKVLDIDWQSRRASVGWDIYKEHRRYGLGKKVVAAGVGFCFDLLGLHRLQAEVLVTNEASQKCAESAGFQEDGVQRQAILRRGEWLDNIIYGILAPERGGVSPAGTPED